MMMCLRCRTAMTCSILSRHVCQFSTPSFTHRNGLQDSAWRGISTSSGAKGPVPHAEPRWKNNSTFKNQRGLCCCPSCGQKSEKQAGMREGSVMAELKTDLNVETGLFSLSSFLCMLLTVFVTSRCHFYHVSCRKTGMLAQQDTM